MTIKNWGSNAQAFWVSFMAEDPERPPGSEGATQRLVKVVFQTELAREISMITVLQTQEISHGRLGH